jgi:glycerate dehydrogenase
MKKIVILDGHTLNPGDLDWNAFTRLGDLIVYDRTPPGRLLGRCRDAEIVLTNKTPLGEDVLRQLPVLKYIGVLATGHNVVDSDAARKMGIVVTNVPGYGTASVAQMVFALLLELCLHVQRHSDSVMEGKWSRSPDFCYWDFPLTELAGKTIGIIGIGRIGGKVADIASAFDMHVIGSSRTKTDQSQRTNFSWAEIPELLERSDVVSIHCPLVPETLGLINRESLSRMKRTAFLLNTSRGPIVVDQDLADALDNGVIAGAGIDVLSTEPPPAGNPLFSAKNCIITPHISWATREARSRLMAIAAANLSAYLGGRPENVVNR